MAALKPDAANGCDERQQAAARLGAERRRVWAVGALLSILAPLIPYLTGSWETLWFALATTWWPLWLRTGLFVAGFHVLLSLVLLPLTFYSGFVLGHRFGLSRQSFRSWASDWLKAVLLVTAMSLLVAGAFYWSVVVWGEQWWLVFGALATLATVLVTFLLPYVVLPLFFKARPLEDAATVARVTALVARARTRVREVCSLDFSRRTAEANAAVMGLGRSRRVVLADTLLAEFPPEEVEAVVAHELAHQVNGDIWRLLAANVATIWLGLGLGAWLLPVAEPLLSLPGLRYVPGYPELVAVTQVYLLLVSPASNWWSRRLEAAADRFALALTSDATAFAGAMRRLACQNLIEIQPPRWAEIVLGSHPSIGRRIAAAEAWAA